MSKQEVVLWLAGTASIAIAVGLFKVGGVGAYIGCGFFSVIGAFEFFLALRE